MTASDALVLFGVTGDLAYRQIFPALQRLVRNAALDVPVVGVARSAWSDDQLREHVRASLADLMSQPFGNRPCMHEALFDDR